MSGNLVRVLVNRDRCVGAGQCVLSAPDVFDQSDQDGRVLILPRAAPAHAVPADAVPVPAHAVSTAPAHVEGPLVEVAIARSAVDLCPSRALSLARP